MRSKRRGLAQYGIALPMGALAMLAACRRPTTYRHVAPSGQDAGDCRASPCRTIGYAVHTALPGDSVVVDSGTYHESVMIDKRVALIGRHATIDARGQASPPNGVRVYGAASAGARVTGFTIRNAGLEGVYVLHTANVTIDGDTVVDNDAYTPANPLCKHHQSDCGEAIHLQVVHGATVRGNYIHHNLGGILLTDEDGPTHDNTIAGNTLADNPKDCGITLASHWIDSVSGNAVAPDVAGVYRNTVSGNTLSGSGGAGIGIFASDKGGAAWGNVVENNTVRTSLMAGLMLHAHTPAQNVDGNVLRNNTLHDNGTDVLNPEDHAPAAISIFSANVPVRHMVIEGNRISNERIGMIVVRLDPIRDLETKNTFEGSVGQKTVVR